MSASLVGSEMCIRDRRAGVPQPSFAISRGRPVRGPLGLIPVFMFGHVAVSYTHLTLPTICSV
eukprot:7198122-Alexandrium_andersonii.AAC.1